jgi:hypothetical protein
MEEDQTRALSLRAAYRFAAEHGLEREAEESRNMPIDWGPQDYVFRLAWLHGRPL